MKDFSTLQKESARALAQMATNRRSKKPQKIAKKSLNDAFSSDSEDTVAEISKELVDLSPFSEISDVNQHGDTGNSLLAVDPAPSSSSESSVLTNICSSEVFAAYKKESGVNFHGSYKFNGEKTSSVLAETSVNLIRQARSQVLNSVDVDSQSKRFLDAVIKIIIDDYLVVPEEKDLFSEIVSAKSHFVFLWFLLWILVLGLIFFFRDGTGSNFSGPLPT